MATSSGELGALIYLCESSPVLKEAKDNALMTALMNTVSNSNMPSFVYLFFKEHCSLNHVDINGNTLLHLAAKSNSIGVAKILKHVFNDISTNKDSTYTTQDNNVFFDLNRRTCKASPLYF